jgi:hypothetical protein
VSVGEIQSVSKCSAEFSLTTDVLNRFITLALHFCNNGVLYYRFDRQPRDDLLQVDIQPSARQLTRGEDEKFEASAG